jgi:VanZ family protein
MAWSVPRVLFCATFLLTMPHLEALSPRLNPPRGESGATHSGWRIMPRGSRKPRTFRLFIHYWLPVLVYIVGVFSISAQANLTPPMPFVSMDKVYHLIEYAILGLLLARAASATFTSLAPLAIALVAISSGIVIGTSDEYFQSFIPGRESSGVDLMADTAGLALAQVAYRVFVRD